MTADKVCIQDVLDQRLLNNGIVVGYYGPVLAIKQYDDRWVVVYANGQETTVRDAYDTLFTFTSKPETGDAFYLKKPRELSHHVILTHGLLGKGKVWWNIYKVPGEQVKEISGSHPTAFFVNGKGAYVDYYYDKFWFEPFSDDTYKHSCYVTIHEAREKKLMDLGKLTTLWDVRVAGIGSFYMDLMAGDRYKLTGSRAEKEWLWFEPYSDKPVPPPTPELDKLESLAGDIELLTNFMQSSAMPRYSDQRKKSIIYDFLGIDTQTLDAERTALVDFVRDLQAWDKEHP